MAPRRVGHDRTSGDERFLIGERNSLARREGLAHEPEAVLEAALGPLASAETRRTLARAPLAPLNDPGLRVHAQAKPAVEVA